MSANDQNENTRDVSGAEEYFTTAMRDLAREDTEQLPKDNNPLPKPQNLLSDGLRKLKGQVGRQASSIENSNSADEGLDITNRIMLRFERRFGNSLAMLDDDAIDRIGFTLLRYYGSIEMAAEYLELRAAQLTYLIANNIELQEYHKLAHTGLKQLTDANVIEELMREKHQKNKPFTKMVYKQIYKGRDKGGYNPAEIGTSGYGDKLSEELASITRKDMDKSKIVVNFNFKQRPIKEDDFVDGEVLTVADLLEAETE